MHAGMQAHAQCRSGLHPGVCGVGLYARDNAPRASWVVSGELAGVRGAERTRARFPPGSGQHAGRAAQRGGSRGGALPLRSTPGAGRLRSRLMVLPAVWAALGQLQSALCSGCARWHRNCSLSGRQAACFNGAPTCACSALQQAAHRSAVQQCMHARHAVNDQAPQKRNARGARAPPTRIPYARRQLRRDSTPRTTGKKNRGVSGRLCLCSLPRTHDDASKRGGSNAHTRWMSGCCASPSYR